MEHFATCFERAWKRRLELRQRTDTDCYRLFNGLGDGFGGVEVDRYGSALVLRSQELNAAELLAVIDPFVEPTSVIFKTGHHGRHAPQLVRGSSARQIVTEFGIRFEVEPAAPTNPGLYLDARPCRQWLRDHCQHLRVLNLFSFTGSLGVAALSGGARSVEHVDGQRRSHARAAENHRLNGLRVDDRDFVQSDVYPFLTKGKKKGRRFGGIILDPPPKVPGKDDQDLGDLVSRCRPLVDEGGWLLVLVHAEEMQLQDLARTAALKLTHEGKAGEDFPRKGDYHGFRWGVLSA